MPPLSSLSDSELIQLVKQGIDVPEKDAVWRLYEARCAEYRAELAVHINIQTMFCWDEDRVTDEVDEVLAIGISNIINGEYEDRGYALTTYLKKIATNRIAKYHRLSKVFKVLKDDECSATHDWEVIHEKLDYAASLPTLKQAFSNLSTSDKQILTLRALEELSPSEVAEKLGINVRCVNTRYFRAFKRLKANFQSIAI